MEHNSKMLLHFGLHSLISFLYKFTVFVSSVVANLMCMCSYCVCIFVSRLCVWGALLQVMPSVYPHQFEKLIIQSNTS